MTTFDPKTGKIVSRFIPPCDDSGRPLSYQQYYRRKMFAQLRGGRSREEVVSEIEKQAHWHQLEAVEFRSPTWAQDTLHQLQHFAVLQPWSHCTDLGHNGAICQTHASFGYTDACGTRKRHTPNGYTYGHTGYAWACTRAFWEQVEGLVDFCILGSGDHHMALACVGECERTIHTKMIAPFYRRLLEWQARAVRVSHGEVGFVEGRIEHHFHGPKKRRYYRERWQILVEHGFDPDRDLMRDDQGLLRIVGKPELESAIRKYNRSRLEDSIEEV
jgi:hypothetical protein